MLPRGVLFLSYSQWKQAISDWVHLGAFGCIGISERICFQAHEGASDVNGLDPLSPTGN